MMHRSPQRTTRRAFLLLDLLTAVAIAGAVLLSLSVAVGTLYRAQQKMARQRGDARLLDAALLTLQTGGKADAQLQIERLASPPPPPDRAWVRISFRQSTPDANAPHASLVGLIPANKVPGGAP
jgi:hypothetical protein